jgi:hypothetical protein
LQERVDADAGIRLGTVRPDEHFAPHRHLDGAMLDDFAALDLLLHGQSRELAAILPRDLRQIGGRARNFTLRARTAAFSCSLSFFNIQLDDNR